MAKLNVKTTPSNNTVVQGQALTASITSTIGTGIFVTDDVSLSNSLETIFGNTQNLPDNNKNVVDNIVDLDNKIDTTKTGLTQDMDAKIAIAKQDISTSVLTDVDQKILDAKTDIDNTVDQTLKPLQTKVRDLEQGVQTLDTDTKQMFKLFNQDLNTKFNQLDNKLVTEVGNVTNGIDGRITVQVSQLSTDINNKLQQFDTKVTQDLDDAKQELNDKIDNLPSSTPAINALEQRLDTVEPKVDTLENNFTSLESKHNTLSRKVTTVENDLNNQITKLNRLEGTVNTEIKKIPTLASNVRDIDTKVDDNLNIVKQKVTEINDKVDQELLKVNQSINKIGPLETKVNDHANRLQAVETKSDNNEQTLNTLSPKVQVAEQKSIEALNIANKNTQKVTAVEGNVTQLESDLQDTNNNLSDLSNKADSNLAEITKLKQKDTDLDQKIDGVDAKITPLSQKVDQNTAKVTTVESNLNKLTTKVSTVEQKANEVDTVKANVSTLEGKVDQGLQDVRTSVAGVVQEQTALKQSLQLVSGNVTTLEQTVTQLENKVQNGNQSVSGLEARVQANETKITATEQGIQLGLAGLDAANKKTLQIESDLSSTTQKVDALDPKVSTLEQSVQSLQPKVNANTQSIQDLTTKVTDVTQQATDLDNKIDTVDAKIDPLSKKLTQVEATVATNTQTANSALQKATNVESIANGLDGRVSANEGNINTLQTSVSDLETVRDDIKQDIKDLQLKDTTLEANYSVLNNKVTANETNVNKLNNKVSSLEQKDQALEQAIQTTDGKIDPIKQSVTALTQKVTGFEATLNTATGKITDLESKDSDLEAKDTQIEQSVTTLTQKVTTVEQTANSANQLATSVNGEVTTLKQTVADHTQTLGQLDTTIDGKVQALDTKLSATISGLDTKVQANTGKVSQVETNLQGIDTRVGQVETDLNNLTSTVDSNRQTLEQSIHDVNSDLGTKIDTINNTTIPDLDTKLDTKIDRTKSDINVETNAKLRQLDNKLSLKIDAIPGVGDDNGFSQFNTKVFKYKESIAGLDPDILTNDHGPVYRIPSVRIGDDGVIHLTCDVRESGGDQERIEVVYARSFDGGKTWDKKVVGRRLKTGNNVDEATSRVMDPTLLYAGNGNLYILAGRWTKGSSNWTQNQDSKNNWDAALLIKSTDNGETWEQHTIGHPTVNDPEGTHIDVINIPANCKGFLGGIDAGLRHSSGKLIFAIQFTKDVNGECNSALLFSDDGIRWSFSTGATEGINYEPAIMELPDGKIVIHCRSEDPDAVVNGKAVKKAFITPDMGANFFPYSPLNKIIGSNTGSTGGHKSEGGLFANRTINGRWIIGACYPQNTVDSNLGNGTNDYGRNQITLYAVNPVKHKKIPLQMIYYKSGASTSQTDTTPTYTGTPYGGYSALTYKACVDGEYLVCAYEDALGISIKNLSDLIPRLEDYCDPRDRIIKDRFRDYYFMADTTNLPLNNVVTCLDGKGRYFSNFVVRGFENNDTITRSSLVKNGYRFKITNKSSNRTSNGLRSWIRLPMTATEMTVSLQIALPSPLSVGITNNAWFPVYKFGFDQYGANWLAGINLEIPANGQNVRVELVRGRQGQNLLGWPEFEYDRVYHMVVEYDAAGIHLYVDGLHFGSVPYDTGYNFASITTGTNAICFGGDWFQKEYISEIGNFYVFMRKLTDLEKRYGMYKRSDPITSSSFETMIELNEVLRNQIRELQMEVRRAKTIAIYPDFVNVPQTEFLKLNYIPYNFKHNISKNELVLYDDCPTYFKRENTIITGFGPDTTAAQNDSTSGYVTTGDGYLFIGRMQNTHTVDVRSLGLNSQEGYSVEYRWKIAGTVVRSQPDSVCFYMNPGNVFLPGQSFIGNGSFLLKSARSSTVTSQKLVLQGGFNSSNTLNNEFGDIAPDTLCKMMIVVSGRSFKIYIDGVEVKSETLLIDWTVGQIGFIRNNNNQIFTGIEVHGLKAWNKALTPQEVQQMANL